MQIDQAFQLALQHHQAGQLPQAENLYRQILAQQPKHPTALHSLGVISHQMGRNDIAVDLIRKAIALRPEYADAHVNLGLVLKGMRQLDEAIAAYRQALTLKPHHAQAQYNLGIALKDSGQPEHAVAAYRKAITLKPDYYEAHVNIGNIFQERRELDQAIAAFRQAILVNPNVPEAYINLGTALTLNHQVEEAIAAYRQAIVLKPNHAQAHNNLGNALKDRGQIDEAIAAHCHAIAIKPDYADAHYNLGNALKDKRKFDAAIAAYQTAIALDPNCSEAHYNLAITLGEKGMVDDAIAAYQRAIALNPHFPEAHSNLISTLLCHPGCDAQSIAEEHRRWNRQHAEPLRMFTQPHSNNRNPDRRLRIGYVSADFQNHPVGRFLLPLFENHDKTQFELFAYSLNPNSDAITQQLQSHTDCWRSIVGVSDSQAADLILKDQIDILIDLAGHTGGNRLLVFARKPAPVQATWLGYPDTTGLSTMDYRLTDALADPPGLSDTLCSEQLIRLPQTAWCFDAPKENLPLDENAAGNTTSITFGSFNNFSKITTKMLQLWAEIVRSTHGSRLLLKANALGCQSVCHRVSQIMEAAGVTSDRLELQEWRKSHREHLASYQQVHIALDTFPYHGTTTTCEALWMGVPVVTLVGKTHVSRVGFSLLTNLGLPELIAHSEEEYIRIAVDLAHNLPRLNHLRSTLRHRMQQSPLMDAPRFARNIESAYRQIWHEWIKSPSHS
jgi:protein O-GlcNAc transferase